MVSTMDGLRSGLPLLLEPPYCLVMSRAGRGTSVRPAATRTPRLTVEARPRGRQVNMNKLCIFIGVTVFGWLGWWIGARFGVMTGYVLSSLGSIVGVYVGWRINRDYMG